MASIESDFGRNAYGPVWIDLGGGLSMLVSPTAVVDTDVQAVGWRDHVDADQFFASIRSWAAKLTEALSAAAPTKLSAEFGLKAAVKSGKLTALLVEGAGEATIKVTLEWDRTKAD